MTESGYCLSIQMFQKLQKEREHEEQKLEAGKVALEQQQGQLEKELTDQKSRLKQLLRDVSAAEGRLGTLQEEERRTEGLERMLSQASKSMAAIRGRVEVGLSWSSGEVCKKDPDLATPGEGRRTKAGRKATAGKDGQGHREVGQMCLW